MAARFIGLHMKVTLKDPPGHCVAGRIIDVEAASSLTLADVYVFSTHERFAQIRIDAANIDTISETSADDIPARSQNASASEPAPAVPGRSPYPSQLPHEDPAILSVGRSPGVATPFMSRQKIQQERKVEFEQGPYSLQHTLRPKQQGSNSRLTPRALEQLTDVKYDESYGQQSNGVEDQTVEVHTEEKKTRARRSRQSRRQATAQAAPDAAIQDASNQGWRQTPILENADSIHSFQPYRALKRQGKGRAFYQDNGWASEDVTEEMGDFDFEDNLAKFDKRTIFDQRRKEDLVDEASRLVSHNRRPRDGAAGVEKLHHTQNVLDLPSRTLQNADYWNSEADVALHEEGPMGGRASAPLSAQSRNEPSSQRTESRTAPSRRSRSRKAAGPGGSRPLSRVSSSVSRSRAKASDLPTKPFHPSPTRRESVRLSLAFRSHRWLTRIEQHSRQGCDLRLVPSNRRVEAVSPLQMLNLENIAANELALTEDLMAENAGRGIAEVAIAAVKERVTQARPRFPRQTQSQGSAKAPASRSMVAVIAGNNKSGIRAVAAGRHLRNKNMEVSLCLVGIEREQDLLEDMRRQVQLYRNLGGKVFHKNEFFEHLRKESSADRARPVSLIIDALLGLTISFEELRVGDQASVYELMEWANRNEAPVLSVDVPTGVEPTTGKIAVIDGNQLYVKPRYVVAVGAPMRGLLEYLTSRTRSAQEAATTAAALAGRDEEEGSAAVAAAAAAEEDEDERRLRLYIADMGLGSAVWRKAGTKIRRGVDFDGRWVVEMERQGTVGAGHDLEEGEEEEGARMVVIK